jgi:hypothetical protein
MKAYRYETTTPLPSKALFSAISAVEHWPEWDAELEWTKAQGAIRTGSAFTLKPAGGPKVAMEVVAAEAPRRFADVAHLPLAKLFTEHLFEERDGATRVAITIRVSGPLGFFWDRIVARKQAEGAAEQTRAFLAFAERFA